MKICKIEGCDNIVMARGWCSKHYSRWYNHGDPLFIYIKPGKCSIKNCNKPVSARGFCESHYSHWRKYKDPLFTVRSMHGQSRTRDYKIWQGMRQRCLNPKNSGYKNYGGRGITVCNRWKNSFLLFHKDIGDSPEGTQIDRIDNDGNYEPDNCRWVTQTVNANNKRPTRKGLKLTKEQVVEIRSLYPTFTQQKIADKYNVNNSVICEIINYKSWRNV